MIKLNPLLSTLFIVLAHSLIAAPSPPQNLLAKIKDFRKAHEYKIIQEFTELLSIPNVSSDTENIRKNAVLIKQMMENAALRLK